MLVRAKRVASRLLIAIATMSHLCAFSWGHGSSFPSGVFSDYTLVMVSADVHSLNPNGSRMLFQSNEYDTFVGFLKDKNLLMLNSDRAIPGRSADVENSIRFVDLSGVLAFQKKVGGSNKLIAMASFPPSGKFMIAACYQQINSMYLLNAGRSTYTVYHVDTSTGLAIRIFDDASDLGEVHPDESSVLLRDSDGFICLQSLRDNSVKRLCEGRNPYWNSKGDAVRYTLLKEETPGKDLRHLRRIPHCNAVEYEISLKDGAKRPIGKTGSMATYFRWLPDRQYGARFIHYDTIFHHNACDVYIESADGAKRWRIAKDINFPCDAVWIPSRQQSRGSETQDRATP